VKFHENLSSGSKLLEGDKQMNTILLKKRYYKPTETDMNQEYFYHKLTNISEELIASIIRPMMDYAAKYPRRLSSSYLPM
jgi:hypothetical protein